MATLKAINYINSEKTSQNQFLVFASPKKLNIIPLWAAILKT